MVLLHMVVFFSCLTQGLGNTYFMDSPTACGQRFPVVQDSVYVRPRGSVGVSNPPASCVIYFESSNVGSDYKFEIVVEAAQFRDCNIQLRVFEGIGVDGSWIRMIGCGTSSSTARIYSSGPEITLQLTRSRDQYFFRNDFSVKLTVYKDPNSTLSYSSGDPNRTLSYSSGDPNSTLSSCSGDPNSALSLLDLTCFQSKLLLLVLSLCYVDSI